MFMSTGYTCNDSLEASGRGNKCAKHVSFAQAVLPAQLLRATLGQPLAIRLHQPACGAPQGRSSTHQFSPRRPNSATLPVSFSIAP
jgi:hypothetical protein